MTGAPGTGKTYLAKQIAARLILNEDYSNEIDQDELFKYHIGFVQFHPSYDYTDFVEGLRPKKKQNGFERVDGVFKEFCKDAIAQSEDFIKGHLLGKEFNIDGFQCEITDFDGKNFKWKGTEEGKPGIDQDNQKITLESIYTILSRCYDVSELDNVIKKLSQEIKNTKNTSKVPRTHSVKTLLRPERIRNMSLLLMKSIAVNCQKSSVNCSFPLTLGIEE